MILHGKHLELQKFEERFDTKDYDCAYVLHCRDHEPFVLAQGLAT
jgi:hypothetical protein